jgi:anti-anti-sigma factor
MITTRYDPDRNALVCVFTGMQDSGASQTASEQFQAAWQSAQADRREPARRMAIVFDLAGVDFISSAFLRLCLQAAKMAGGGAFRIVNTTPAVKKLFVVAGLEQLIGRAP